MTSECEEIDGVKVVRFSGDLDTNSSPEAEAFLTGLIDDGSDRIAISFAQLNYVSSAGLRILLATAKKLKAGGGSLALCCLNETVQEVFEISGFIAILNVFATEEEALATF
jgi:anti-anti-sigma factor